MNAYDKWNVNLLTSMPPAQEVRTLGDGSLRIKTQPFIIVGENGVYALDYAVYEMDRATKITEQPVGEGILVRATMPAPRVIALKPAGKPEIVLGDT
jgi:hypothetical protein